MSKTEQLTQYDNQKVFCGQKRNQIFKTPKQSETQQNDCPMMGEHMTEQQNVKSAHIRKLKDNIQYSISTTFLTSAYSLTANMLYVSNKPIFRFAARAHYVRQLFFFKKILIKQKPPSPLVGLDKTNRLVFPFSHFPATFLGASEVLVVVCRRTYRVLFSKGEHFFQRQTV